MVRLDSMGDVLISGPAIRAVAAGSTTTTLLVGPLGAQAAELLPGVHDVLVWDCPWISAYPPAVEREAIDILVAALSSRDIDQAVVLTSFHQSALPTALLLRLAGIARITAVSEDYPGRLLDVRVPPPPDGPEPERMLAVAQAAGFALPPGDDGRLRVREPLPSVDLGVGEYVVVHPGVSASARAYPAECWTEVVELLAAQGRAVVVTGGAAETGLTKAVAGASALDCGGRFSVAELAAVLAGASVMVVANTGPAHLAAAVGTPVVSLFAPVVPAVRWAPYGVPTTVLGAQNAPCRDTRATACPIPGHPCLSAVAPADVVRAAHDLLEARRMRSGGGAR